MAIRKLPPLLVNQIAAGEVIERPASVVKELIENSLDAGATRVDVDVEEGGRQSIRVSDDGTGIVEDDLPLAVAPHATSKLSGPGDLASIRTLGFRGEALASIASVSRLRLTSRATVEGKMAECGYCITATCDDVSAAAPAACAAGTTVEVRDMFYNMPARRKFMRSPGTEFGHIADSLLRTAIARPQVSLTLRHNGRRHFELPPGQTHRQRCVDLLGHELDEALLEIETEAAGTGDAMRLWGLVGLPSIARSSSKFQYLCLNGRPIRDRQITHAIREAYRGLIPHDRQPLAVVALVVDAADVDVNVHPAKAEVRFGQPSRVHAFILTAMRQRLLASDLTPQMTLTDAPAAPQRFDSVGDAVRPATPGLAVDRGNARRFVDDLQRMDPAEKGFVYQEVKRALESEPLVPDGSVEEPASTEPMPLTLIPAPGVLQVQHSYLVTEDESGLLIVDQHALHERVMFEQLCKRITDQPLESQRLLMPATFSATAERLAVLDQLQPLLGRIGIEAAAIGPNTVAIHAFASFLFDRQVDPVSFVEQLLDHAQDEAWGLDDGGQADEAALYKVLDMMACKAAIKAGDRLAPQELAQLLAQRDQVDRSSNCPHGRPTTIRLSFRELEKQFKRR